MRRDDASPVATETSRARSPFTLSGPTLLNFSGGRTSAMMVRLHLDAHDGELPADTHIVFANTGKERPETLEFVNECSLRWGVPIVWIERDGTKPAGQRFREVNYESAAREGEPFAELIRGRRFLPNAVMRFCTEELKIIPARDFMRSLGHDEWTSVIGLRRDEERRVANVRANARDYETKRCPLHAAGITKGDVLAFWRAQPFDLRLRPWESNCDVCFLKGRSVRERIMRDHPDLAGWWAEQESEVGGFFHAHERGGYAALRERVRRLPLLPMDLDGEFDESSSIPCTCTDRRVKRCGCLRGGRRGHTLACVLARADRRAA